MSPSAATRVEWARRLALALVSHGYLEEHVVMPLVDEAGSSGTPYTALLISRGLVSADVAIGMLSQLTQLPAVDLAVDRPSPEAVDLVPLTIAREYRVVGFRLDGEQLLVAFGEPPDADDLRTLSAMLGYGVVPLLADPYAIERELQVPAHVASMPDSPPPTVPPPPPTVDAPVGSDALAEAIEATVRTISVDEPAVAEEPPMGEVASKVAFVSSNGHAADDEPLHLDDLLRHANRAGASDLHLTAGLAPCMRVNGAVRPI
ncbi:MAG TPA: hypothetical protein VED63_10840, partial [Acidimicrobiales bacterium]|nr:hypothetical protein [Acidimicrobiales bacterium]